MENGKTFQCTVVTPEHVALECEPISVVFPAHDGEMGVLRDRAALICKMGIGVLRITGSDFTHTFFVDGGFAQAIENHLTLLTAQAIPPAQLDEGRANSALVEARAIQVTDDPSLLNRSNAIQRAQVQLKLIAAG